MACEFVSVCLTAFFFIKLVIYKCISSLLIVSATRRREDIKILLCLSAPMRSSLKQEVTTMDAHASAILTYLTRNSFFWENLVKNYQNCQFKLKPGS